MTTASSRVVVYSILVNLLLQAAAAPFSTQDILNIFGNPVEDIKNTVFNELRTQELKMRTEKPIRKEDEADTKMIEVPPNTESGRRRCTGGAQKDTNGVCRHPF